MRSIRFIAARRAVAASALAVAVAAGIGVSGPAASASVGGCAWQPLTLINNWQSADVPYGTGDPSFCIAGDGMVYLSGSLTQPGNGGSEVAVLPSDAWPASYVYLNVYTFDGTLGVLRIDPDGGIYAYQGSATTFTSLAAVSFPSASVAQVPLSPLNDWKSAGGQYGTGDPSYALTNGIIHLSGSLNGLGAISWDAAALPQGATTCECIETNIYAYDGAMGSMEIVNNHLWVGYGGHLFDGFVNADVLKFSSLAGISFPAAPPAWHPLGMLSGWNTGPNVGLTTASYEIIGGVVYLEGQVVAASASSSGPFAVLPPGARPAHKLYINIWSYGDNADLEIEPNGNMWILGHANSYNDVSLAPVSYRTLS